MSLACLRLVVNSLSFQSWSLRWAMSESFHSQLSSWVKLFSASLDLHEVLRCSLSIFWWSFSDCLCSVCRLIIKSSFHTYILTQLDYSSQIFWFNSNTWVEPSDSTWYWFQVRIQFKFSTQFIKQSKMTSNVKIYYFWIYYVIIFERLSCNKRIYFSSRCLHYLVALSIKYIV